MVAEQINKITANIDFLLAKALFCNNEDRSKHNLLDLVSQTFDFT